jgi:hypothetical protein
MMRGIRGDAADRSRGSELKRRKARLRAAREARKRAEHRRAHPSIPETRRRSRARRRRVWATGAAALGVLLTTAGARNLAAVHDRHDTVRAFRTARPCPAGAASASAEEDCLRTLPATVRDTVTEESGDTRTYTLKLAGPRPVPATLRLKDPEPLLRDLHRGDDVTLTIWRSRATAVTKDGVSQPSTATPKEAPNRSTAFALALLAAGVYGIFAGVVIIRHARRELPDCLGAWGAAAWGGTIATIPAVGYGYLFGGPAAATAVWAAMVAGLAWIAWREADG